MASYNKVLLMGNLTRDIEMRFTPSGMGVGKFAIATNRKFRDSKTNEVREEVTFVDCEAWGKTAETMSQYLSKGRPVFIEGRLKLDQWDDKQSGQKRSKLLVVVDRFQFIGGPAGEGRQGGQAGGAPAQRPAQAAPQRHAPPAPGGEAADFGGTPDDLDIQEEHIPF